MTTSTTTAIADMAPEDRPRERLLAKGPRALRDAEVLAILVGSGTRGCSSVELSRRILKQLGGTAGLAGASTAQLCAIHGVGPALAARLVAARELFRRSANPRIPAGSATRAGAAPPPDTAPPVRTD
ncbi:MAG TPA: UPF0758 domain-containing protein [Micrococcaceae bacterium]|jgi:DNA repair protein RadC